MRKLTTAALAALLLTLAPLPSPGGWGSCAPPVGGFAPRFAAPVVWARPAKKKAAKKKVKCDCPDTGECSCAACGSGAGCNGKCSCKGCDGKEAPKACRPGCHCDCAQGACECPAGKDCGCAACVCPTAPGADREALKDRPRPEQNFGIDQGKLHLNQRHSVDGVPATRAQVIEAAGKTLPDYTGKTRLTVIGPAESRKAVLADLEGSPALAPWKGALAVQAYEPTDWAVSRYGFKTDGAPTIYVQAPGGKVVHRQDDYQGGAEALAQALRKADPNYKPVDDKDRRKPDVLPAGAPGGALPLLAFGGLAALALYKRKG